MAITTELTKSAHVQVEVVVDHSGDYDLRRARLSPRTLLPWGPGRLTLTKRDLSCIASRIGTQGASFSIPLTDVQGVSLTPGIANRVITIRTSDRLIHLRVSGAPAFAKRIAIAREAAQSRTGSRSRALAG